MYYIKQIKKKKGKEKQWILIGISFLENNFVYLASSWASLVAQMIKCLPTMRETWVRSLGWEHPLEKEMATHSSILAWKIPRTEDPGRLYSPWGCKELDMTEQLHFTSSFILFFVTPLSGCSSLLSR